MNMRQECNHKCIQITKRKCCISMDMRQECKPSPRTPKTPVHYEAGVQTQDPNTWKPAPLTTKTPVQYEAGVKTLSFNTIPKNYSDACSRNALFPKAPL